MRKTYAYNGITIGIILGIAAGAVTNSGAIAIVAMIGLSILCFVGIRFLENAVDAGVDKASEAIQDKINERKNR